MGQRARFLAGGTSLAVVSAILVLSGCAQRPFTIVDRQVCRTVDASGKCGTPVTTLTTQDKAVYVWFRYVGAKTGQAAKVKFKFTDPTGVQATQEVRTELKPGSGTAAAQLKPPEERGLAPGKYEAEITNDADVAYGPPLTFDVPRTEGETGLPAVAPAPSTPPASPAP